MKFRKTVWPNGNLKITADNEARAWIKEQLKECSVINLWPVFVEEFIGFYYPWLRLASDDDLCDMGALTSSPVLIETANNGGPSSNPRVWWFPNYQIENEFETLKNSGRLVMTLAEE